MTFRELTGLDLFSLGLFCYSAGATIQILEHWGARALTDTSLRSLTLLTVGPLILSYYSFGERAFLDGLISLPPAIAAGFFLWLKARHHVRYRWMKQRK